MDKLDKNIIRSLYEDSTQTHAELADEYNVDENTVTNRVEKLVEDGVINKYTAIPDPGKIGFPVASYHFLGLAENYEDAIEAGMPYFRAFRGSELAMVMLGEYDVILRKVSQSDTRLNVFMNNLINDPDYPSYDKSRTYRVTERIRWRGFDIPRYDRFEVEPVDLTKEEKEVLRVLRHDGRLRTKPNKIATKIDMSPGDVSDVISDLEEKIILGYSIDVNLNKLGWHRGFIGLSSLRGEYDRVVESLQESSSLHVPYIVSGSGFDWAHLGAELICESVSHLDEMTDRIRQDSGSRTTRTLLSTKALVNETVDV